MVMCMMMACLAWMILRSEVDGFIELSKCSFQGSGVISIG